MLVAYSWAMRGNTRSAPERSTVTAMPGILLLEHLGQPLGKVEVHGGVEGERALLLAASISASSIGDASAAARRHAAARA